MSILPGGGILSALNRVKDKATGEESRDIPADLQARLDAGESVDVIADELVARGAAFSNDPVTNLVGQIVLDPLNLIAPGASKLWRSIKAAGVAITVPEQYAKMGLTARAAGVAYNTASRGLSAAGGAIIDKTIGSLDARWVLARCPSGKCGNKGRVWEIIPPV